MFYPACVTAAQLKEKSGALIELKHPLLCDDPTTERWLRRTRGTALTCVQLVPRAAVGQGQREAAVGAERGGVLPCARIPEQARRLCAVRPVSIASPINHHIPIPHPSPMTESSLTGAQLWRQDLARDDPQQEQQV